MWNFIKIWSLLRKLKVPHFSYFSESTPPPPQFPQRVKRKGQEKVSLALIWLNGEKQRKTLSQLMVGRTLKESSYTSHVKHLEFAWRSWISDFGGFYVNRSKKKSGKYFGLIKS